VEEVSARLQLPIAVAREQLVVRLMFPDPFWFGVIIKRRERDR
jgi:hypothetical protein